MNITTLFAMQEIYEASKLSYGGIMVLIGMATVFSVLAIIMLSLYAFQYFFHDLPAKKHSTSKPKVVAVAESAEAVHSDDGEIVAAIAAAIAMAESESGGIKFRVVSFKRR